MQLSDLDLSKTYSYADYLKWTFDERLELIKGKIFKMTPVPGSVHQRQSGTIYAELYSYLRGKSCEVFAAPFDDMLKRYNKLLQKQLNELQAWVHEMHFTGGAIIADFIDKNGNFSPQKFTARRKGIEKENTMLKSEQANSLKRPKGWFKEQISIIKDSVQENMMENIFADMFSDFEF